MDQFKKLLILGYFLFAVLIFIVGTLLFEPKQQAVFFVSGFGFSALSSLIFLLAVPVIATKFKNGFTINFLKNRRLIGILTFLLALTHFSLAVNFFYAWDPAKIVENIGRIGAGLAAFTILLVLALTSNNWSVRVLGKYWKKLHYLVYVALLLVLLHSFSIGLLILKNDAIKLVVLIVVVTVLFTKFWKKFKDKLKPKHLIPVGLVLGLVLLIGCTNTGVVSIDTSLSSQVSPTQIQTFSNANYEVCKENGKPVIRLFSTTWCPHCKWVKNAFESTIQEYVNEDKIVAYHWEVDTGDNALTIGKETAIPQSEMNIYRQFNPKGSIPTFVFGCKYYRVGNGYESQNNLNAEIGEFKAVIEALLKE